MEKIDRVIAGIEQHMKYSPPSCFGCPYDDGEDYCMDRLLTDCLEFLNEYRDYGGDMISRSELLAE